MTKDNTRRQEAINAANLYAPAPNGSMLTYAVVGSSIAVMLMFAIAGFYGVDFLRLLILAVGLALAAGLAGVATNRVRTNGNHQAIESEYLSRGVGKAVLTTSPVMHPQSSE